MMSDGHKSCANCGVGYHGHGILGFGDVECVFSLMAPPRNSKNIVCPFWKSDKEAREG
jgi:hypothetical protein